MQPPPIPDISGSPLFTEREVRFDSRSFLGMAGGKIRSALGADASIKLGHKNGDEVWAEGKSEGMLEPRVALEIDSQPWLEIRCDVEHSQLGPVKAVAMEQWRVVNSRTGAVLGICNFRSVRDQLLEFYDWFSSQVKDDAGQVIGELKGIFRFPRLIPIVAWCSEKRFRIFRGGRLLAVVARPPRVWERFNPFRFRMISQRLQIRFEDGISDDDRLFVYGLLLVNTRTPL